MADTEKTRAELVDEHVVRNALNLLLCNVVERKAVGLESFDLAEVADELTAPTFEELWPRAEDDPLESDEYLLADMRSTALTVAMLGWLTTTEAQDRIRAEAVRLSALTSAHIEQFSREA